MSKKTKSNGCEKTTKIYLEKHPELVEDMFNIVLNDYKTRNQIQSEYRKKHPDSKAVEISKLCTYITRGCDPKISSKFVFKQMEHQTLRGIRSATFFKAVTISQSDYNDYQEFLEFKKFQQMKYGN